MEENKNISRRDALERMFARACGGKVKATVTEAILRGDKSCVYRIELL